MTDSEKDMVERIMKYLNNHYEVQSEIRSRLSIFVDGLGRFEETLKDHVKNWIPDVPREKSVARLIHHMISSKIN